jgi:hypothetical protein
MVFESYEAQICIILPSLWHAIRQLAYVGKSVVPLALI